MEKERDQIELFVPGRLCLFGEHSDWAGFYRIACKEIEVGQAIVTGIEQGIHGYASKADKFEVIYNVKGTTKEFSCDMELQALKSVASEGSFFSYVAGVASYFKEHYKVRGLRLVIDDMTLPMKRGLSSSAAICVLTARAFNRVYSLHMNTLGEMQAAYRGELRTPSKCGRLDQACAFGIRPVVMTFDGDDVEVERLRIKGDFFWVFADLNSHKDTVKILDDLHKCFPIAKDPVSKDVQSALGKENHSIIARAIECFKQGNALELGRLMEEAQKLFDTKIAPASPAELKAPILHNVLSDEYIKQLVFGGKGVGSQGDGTVQFLAKDLDSQIKLVEYLNSKKMEAFPFTIHQQRSVKRAIIPVAGFGTRVYPETRGIKKEFFPIVDKDGMLKPAILILLEELISAGIEKICLVIGEDEEEIYKKFFERRLSQEHIDKLPEDMRKYEDSILEIGRRLRYVVQKERKGFGHAVYQCREFTNSEPVLLLLGDTVYQSYEERSCIEQLLDSYESTEKLTVGIAEVSKEDVFHYGILRGKWLDTDMRILDVDRMVEKPSIEYAEKSLSMTLPNGRVGYLNIFGNYVLPPTVFECLEKNIRENKLSKGEIQLTDALDEVRGEYGMQGYRINGRAFDIGNPQQYRETVKTFGM